MERGVLTHMNNKMKKHKVYDENPIAWLKDGWGGVMEKYLWVMWLIIAIMIVIAYSYGVIAQTDTNNIIHTNQSAFEIVAMLPILAYIHFKLFTVDELIVLLNNKNMLIQTFAQYVFSGALFTLLGILYLFTPSPNNIYNITLVLLTLLGGFSLFNILYQFLNDLYFSVVRKSNRKFAETISDNQDIDNSNNN